MVEVLSKNHSTYSGRQKNYTTLNFGEIVPLTFKSYVQKDSWRIRPNATVKMAPMAVPTRADIRYNLAGFKVDYHLLDDYFDDYVAGKDKHFAGSLAQDIRGGLCMRLADLWNALFYTNISDSYGMEQGPTAMSGIFVAYDTLTNDGSVFHYRPYLHVFGEVSKFWTDEGLVNFVLGPDNCHASWVQAGEYDGNPIWTEEQILEASQSHDVHLIVRGVDTTSNHGYDGFVWHAFVNFNRRHGTQWHKIFESTGLQLRCVEIQNPKLSDQNSSIIAGYSDAPILSGDNGASTESNFNAMVTQGASGMWGRVDYERFTPRCATGITQGDTILYENLPVQNAYYANHKNKYLVDFKFSAYRILAFLKVYNDYFERATFSENSTIFSYLKGVRLRGVGVLDDGVNMLVLPTHLLRSCVDSLLLYYPNDCVTTLQRRVFESYKPNMSWADNTGDYYSGDFDKNIVVSTPNRDALDSDYDGNSHDSRIAIQPNGASPNATNINSATQVGYYQKLFASGLRYLQTMNFVGSRTVDRLRALFGITCDYQRMQRCECLGVNSSSINVEQINATADTYQNGELVAQVGDYVGQGWIKQSSQFVAKSNDCMGEIVVLNWITLRPVYSHRVDGNLFHIHRDSFFQPHLDGLGYYVPVSQSEINVPRNQMYDKHKVAGYRPMYDEYRFVATDTITGDFKRYQGMDAWIGQRQLDTTDTHIEDYHAEDIRLLSYRRNHDEYDSLFVEGSNVDKFIILCETDVLANRPLSDPMQAIGLNTGEMDVSQGGDIIH